MASKRITQFDFAAIDRLGLSQPTKNEHTPTQSATNSRVPIISAKEGIPCNVDPKTGLRKFTLVEAIKSEIRPHHYLSPIHDSPWKFYESEYQLCLGEEDLITVAARQDMSHHSAIGKDAMSELVLVKTISGPGVEDKLRMLQEIRHNNIVSPLQIFKSEGSCHVVYEYMAVPLSSVAANPRLNDIRLAAILGQILGGLSHLESKGVEHGSLTCSNILLHPHGDVKIGLYLTPSETKKIRLGQENKSQKSLQDIRALSSIVMELMQGYVKEGGAVGVDDLHRWSPDAVGFLSHTLSAASAAELIKHPLLQLPWQKEHLIGLVSFVSIASRIVYRYPPN